MSDGPNGDAPASKHPISVLLDDSAGTADQEQLMDAVYSELRHVAAGMLGREKSGQTLQPTALVHEAYLRVFGGSGGRFANERHFFAAAAETMRRILIDRARRKRRIKHGGDMHRVDDADLEIPIDEPDADVLVIDETLQKLEQANPRAREIVNLRFFAGLSNAETAAVLGTSLSTIEREWRFIKAWIHDALTGSDS